MKKRSHIELFAGCGGMALGMEAANLHLFFANELSPMAAETFAYNILNEDLLEKSREGEKANKTKWISSKFSASNLTERLRENPLDSKGRRYSDLTNNIEEIEESILVGDINELLQYLNDNNELVNQLQERNVDVLSGGPPCQGFSLAGLRVKDDYKNQLPLSFAEMASLIQPKVVLLENVKGITSPFTVEGKKYYAWLEVSKAFAERGFVPVCMMLNSKYFGVPQNRPRFILFAFRKDVFDKLLSNKPSNDILKASKRFYNLVIDPKKNVDEISNKEFKYYDIENVPELFDGEILPLILNQKGSFISSKEAINDLSNADKIHFIESIKSKYSQKLTSHFPKDKLQGDSTLHNHEKRRHCDLVMERFKLYQVISQFKNGLQSNAYRLISNKTVEADIEQKILDQLRKNDLGVFQKRLFKSNEELKSYIVERGTRKHSQRALLATEPAPAQLTIPDDVCHYEKTRTLTVREMARFQSFPDWFEFRSKVTTGGKMRKFETPQYTQVGNAVPPLLAEVLGNTINNILDTIE